MTSQFTCELCEALQGSAENAKLDDWSPDTSPAHLRDDSSRCGGLCTLIWRGVEQLVHPNAEIRTNQLRIGGGIGSASVLRVLGACDFETTFDIEFFTEEEYSAWPWSVFGQAHGIPSEPLSSLSTADITEWLQRCSLNHSSCRRKTIPPPLPTRILDLGLAVLDPEVDVRLIESGCRNAEYVALSHCWGQEQLITTATTTYEDRRSGIRREQLSKTFRDAIQICRKLSVRYLWIDSLCIIQNDTADWERESSNMAAIYENAYFVISADSAADGQGGCLGLRQAAVNIPCGPAFGAGAPASILAQQYVSHIDLTVANADRDSRKPLDMRAWALQEWLLPVRVLHFTEHEIVRECKMSIECECSRAQVYQKSLRNATEPNLRQRLAEYLKLQEDAVDVDRFDLLRWWLSIVEEYTMRGISVPTDRLPGLSGLVHRLHETGPQLGDYTGGLWSFNLLEQILWARWSGDDPIKPRPKEYIAPTWSWASIAEPVTWYEEDNRKYLAAMGRSLEVVASLEEVHCRPSGLDPFGRLEAGHICLAGPTIEATLPTSQVLTYGQCNVRFNGHEELFTLDVDITNELHAELSVFCVKIYDVRDVESDLIEACKSLVLRRSPSMPHCYERIGMDNDLFPVDWFQNAQVCEFKIV